MSANVASLDLQLACQRKNDTLHPGRATGENKPTYEQLPEKKTTKAKYSSRKTARRRGNASLLRAHKSGSPRSKASLLVKKGTNSP